MLSCASPSYAEVPLGQWVGAHEQVAVVGDRGVRRPHLLPVDDVLIAIALGTGTQ